MSMVPTQIISEILFKLSDFIKLCQNIVYVLVHFYRQRPSSHCCCCGNCTAGPKPI